MTWLALGYGVALSSCLVGIVLAAVLRNRVTRTIGWCGAAAALAAFAAGAAALVSPQTEIFLWGLPTFGPLALGTTPLGGLFTCIAAMVYVPTSVYTSGYLRRYEGEYSATAFAIWYYVLFLAVIGLFICRDTVSFFIVWETIAISSAALVAFEWRTLENARAAYTMLFMSEAGTVAALLAILLALHGSTTLLFSHGAAHLGPVRSWAIFLLSLFGFGVKAGLVPVNSWLPQAHPVAPANVSALLSAVILNAGIFGILLVNLELAPVTNPAFGVVALVVGVVSALVGILYATVDDDLKTMLAYSSVENLGIALAAIGAGLVFIAYRQMPLAAIGLSAGLYHVLNHSAYKGLLFLAAGTVHAQTGLRSIDRLGGLIRLLPATAFCFLIGALSIAAIPPFNGFVSEWLTLETLLRSAELTPTWLRVVFALSGAALALTAALAITCFVKAFAMTFLGFSRSPLRPSTVHEAPRSMTFAMYMLVVACGLLGILPTFVLGAIDFALAPALGGMWVQHTLVPAFFAPYSGERPLPPDFVASFHALGAQLGLHLVPGHGLVVMLRGGAANPVVFAMSTTYLCLILLVLLAATYLGVRALAEQRRVRRALVWAGGLRSLVAEMTYTGTGFSNPVRVIFEAIFRPAVEDERETIHEHFRTAIRRGRNEVFVVDRVVGRPATAVLHASAKALARMHHGRLDAYVLYALLTLLVASAVIWMR
jgi:hydrogenase-4 component B